MGTAVNGTDAPALEIIGVHLLPSLAVLMPGACGVATPHAPGRGRAALFKVHDDRRATREIDGVWSPGLATHVWRVVDWEAGAGPYLKLMPPVTPGIAASRSRPPLAVEE